MKNIIISIRMLVVMTILTGGIYTGVVTVIAQGLFPHQSNGSLVEKNGSVLGSHLIQQKFTQDKYFWGRPSAGDYATVPSGASNLGPTSETLKKQVDERKADLERAHPDQAGKEIPQDLLFTSGSGLDPDISPEAAFYQSPRVAKARGVSVEEMNAIVDKHIKHRRFGFMGEPVVNVLALNLDLDEKKGQ